MSIENGVTTGAPKAAQAATGHGHGKAKAGGAVAGGFAALLQGLGEEALPMEPGLAGEGDHKLSLTSGAADLPVPADAGVSGLGLPLPQVPAPDLGGAVAEAQARTLPAVAAGGEATGRPLTPRAAPARTEPLPLAGDGAHEGAAADTALLAREQDAGATSGELQPLLRQAALAHHMVTQRLQAADAAAQGMKAQRGEEVAARLGWQMSERLAPAGGQPQILLATGAGETGLRPFERRTEKAGHRSGGVGEVGGAWTGPALPDGPRMDVPAAAPDAGLMTEMRVAEQVSHWAGRGGVQNAELELDGLGEGPVKVSITLQGQEARVEFRADQAQTRQVLEDSMPHLRDLLAREGLVLSGMSVGTSGSDGSAGRQQQEGRRGARESMVAVPELAAVAAGPAGRGGALSGRSVDLFV